ncbi:hypothetical protein EPUL_006186 [Erysiphe pulchra]|uniref:Uncharacterized protein n=1 Tax=Erysiphe pulchra TaxID=225359 RepID=A0A2S4PQY9_9PEZI|nr:hypothetical protein EPUL_006186 [Erysiphe pulchra]
MSKSRGLLNLVGPYLEDIEKSCPEAEAEFLVLISEVVSQAIRGERIYAELPSYSFDGSASQYKENSWGAKVVNSNRRIMIRLGPDHEARKAEPLLPRQQLQRLISDPTLVVDAWQISSGISILAPIPAKAATILQYKDAIALCFGNATVERQETWTALILGPIPKLITTLDGKCDPFEEFILQEPGLTSVRDELPIKHIAWTNRSKESSDTHGEIRVQVPTAKTRKFLPRLQLFGQAVNKIIRERKQIITCEKCRGFHATRTCARKKIYSYCRMEAHDVSCTHPPQCLNYRGPHESTDTFCPTRPGRKNGATVRLPGSQLRQRRTAEK